MDFVINFHYFIPIEINDNKSIHLNCFPENKSDLCEKLKDHHKP